MSENHSDANSTPGGGVVPGIGVCKLCDARAVAPECWGRQIEGEICLGCGAPVYELLRRTKGKSA